MPWQSLYENVLPYVVLISTPEGFGTGFLFVYNDSKTIAAFATAAHVVEHAEDWKQPLKLRHYSSGKEIFLTDDERLIALDRRRDSASILIKNPGGLPTDLLPMIDASRFKKVGAEVGWVGFPAIAVSQVCLFTGRIAAFLSDDDSYLIDGVAINGVSGGPVFCRSNSGVPELIGTVSAYVPNRQRGDALPGLLRVQDVTSFQATIKTLKSLDEARRKKEENEREQRQAEAAAQTPATTAPTPTETTPPEIRPRSEDRDGGSN